MTELKVGRRLGGLREGDVIKNSLGDALGRWWGQAGLWVVVIASGGADVGNFYQVLADMLNVPDRVVWTFVVVFAAVALALAHLAGRQARQALNRRDATHSRTLAIFFASVWLVLGVLALVTRYHLAQMDSGDASTFNPLGSPSSSSAPSGPDLSPEYYAAWFFFALYIGSGSVAAAAGYFRPDPAARKIGYAERLRTKATRRHARTVERHERIEQTCAAIDSVRESRQEAWEVAQEQCRLAAERLKQEAWLFILGNEIHKSAKGRSAGVGSAGAASAGVEPAGVGSAGAGSAEVAPVGVTPAEATSVEIAPTGVGTSVIEGEAA